MSELSRFPLTWPDNVARTAPHQRGAPHFQERTISAAASFLLAEINRLNGRSWDHSDETVIISCNVRPTLAGKSSSSGEKPSDPGVAVFFNLRFHRGGKWHERPTVMTCDKWQKVADNLHAIAKDIEAQRGRLRWGCTSIEQAFKGYIAIPERTGGKSWWERLGVAPTASIVEITDRFNLLAKKFHPDKGGRHEDWIELQNALEQAKGAAR